MAQRKITFRALYHALKTIVSYTPINNKMNMQFGQRSYCFDFESVNEVIPEMRRARNLPNMCPNMMVKIGYGSLCLSETDFSLINYIIYEL
jgi:hypothetical protein